MKLRKVLGTTLALITGLAIAGCSAPGSNGGGGSSGDDDASLRIVAASGFLSLDPQLGQIGNTSAFYVNVFDGLYTVSPNGEVVPSLVTDSEHNDDFTEYTFSIRDDATFHDGSPLTAEDVKFTIERAKDPAIKSPTGGDLSSVESVEVVSDYEVAFHLNTPNPLLPNNLLAMSALIVPKAYIESVGAEEFAQKPIGSGPFKLASYAEGQSAALDRNDEYWGEKAKVAHLEFLFATEQSTQSAMVQGGQADMIMGIDARMKEQMEASGLQVLSTPSGDPIWTLFQAQPGVEDVRVRQALNYAINRDQIIETVFLGEAKPLAGMIASSLPGYDSSLKPYAYDPEKAKQLLDEAGFNYETPFVITLAEGRFPGSDVTTQAMVSDLEKIGVKASVNPMEYGAMGNALVAKEATNPYINMANRAFDPLAGLNSQTSCTGALSTTCDPEYDALLKAASALQGEARSEALAKANEYLFEHPAGIFLYEPNLITVMSPKVQYTPVSGTVIAYNLASAVVEK